MIAENQLKKVLLILLSVTLVVYILMTESFLAISSSFSALLLNFRYKKQENQAAILKRFLMDADKSVSRALVNLHPFRPLFKSLPFCVSKGLPFEI
ncbi:MAG: hypothetical protein Q3M24_05280 [Candidatus Electrothrix aestuarii]|uniref:Uncharacterized protein n=1 Tax=Candidatus Electrothrix aestuarii TaxID=3062594 RepID=A0AAU8LZ39_9BACT|nr:hypothetical protein [Candidatus Electrothrix aestuarii]